jgi:hypothetical protein
MIPLLLILLMQFRPEGIMGNKELPEIYARLRASLKDKWRGWRKNEKLKVKKEE